MSDPVTRPDWYTWIPGIECMDVARHFPYCIGAAIKYIWRAGRKDPAKRGEDLRKAIEYLRRELEYAEGSVEADYYRGFGANEAELRALDERAP